MSTTRAPYRYHFGDAPLEGWTIKVALGKGGFGEVYLALNSAGKEAALKRLYHGPERVQRELSGVRQCLNLKHPHLVETLDIRQDATGDSWVVMEHVRGDPLSRYIPSQGLDPSLAAEWFRQLADVLHYLHRRNIIHRDLKSDNVFLEDGGIKLGDVGLCCSVSPGGASSNGAGGTGTAEYSAPETFQGRYDHRSDIYSAGILLYEMLTGAVPFRGNYDDVRLQHEMQTPDWSKVPPAFVPVLERALDKDRQARYGEIKDFAHDVQEAAAGRAVTRTTQAPVAVPSAIRSVRPTTTAPTPNISTTEGNDTPLQATRLRELGTAMLLVSGVSFVLSLLAARVYFQGDWTYTLPWWLLTQATSWAILITGRLWPYSERVCWRRRFVLAGIGVGLGLFALWLNGYAALPSDEASAPWARAALETTEGPLLFIPSPLPVPPLLGMIVYFALMLGGQRWWVDVHDDRPQRFSIMAWLACTVLAFLLLPLLPSHTDRALAFMTMTATSALVQAVSRRRPRKPPSPKRWRLQDA